MKARIIHCLHRLATESNATYLKELAAATNKSEDSIRQEAKQLLSRILQDYSRFSISTIDTFFQRIVRAFLHDLRLSTNYQIELDSQQVLDQAVDFMLEEAHNNPGLLKWIKNFIAEEIRQGKRWNISQSIKQRAGRLLEETFLQQFDHLENFFSQRDHLNLFLSECRKIKEKITNNLSRIGEKAAHVMEQGNLELSDFKGKKTGVANHFFKIQTNDPTKWEATATARKALDKAEEWYIKGTKAQSQIERIFPSLNGLLYEAINYWEESKQDYWTVHILLENCRTMALFADIAHHLQKLCDKQEITLLNFTNLLINRLVTNNPTPFLYERVGQFIHHYMIDEFQDTSRLQWENLFPLLDNALAQEHQNFLVGDGKQSIYRFRNGDWRLLQKDYRKDLEEKYPIDEKFLSTNYRSAQEVVDSNNDFFSKVTDYYIQEFAAFTSLDETELPIDYARLKELYADVEQQVGRTDFSGGVFTHAVHYEKEKSKAEEELLQRVVLAVEELQWHGVKAHDIAILTRKKEQGEWVGNALMERERTAPIKGISYRFVSEKTLHAGRSAAAHLLLSTMQWLLNKHERVHHFNLSIWAERMGEETQKAITKLPQLRKRHNELLALSVPQLLNEIILFWGTENLALHEPVIYFLKDRSIELRQQGKKSPEEFILWWEEQGINASLPSSSSNAIQIMTIHKSKGLQFRAVLLPFCDWETMPTIQNSLWISTEQKPFDFLPLLSVGFSKKLQESWFSSHFYEETFLAAVDSLNMLYVAMTRAEQYMAIFYTRKTSGTPSTPFPTTAHLLHRWKPEGYHVGTFPSYDKITATTTEPLPRQEKREALDAEKETEEPAVANGLSLCSPHLRIRSSYADLPATPIWKHRRNKGKLLHSILAHIRTEKDIPFALRKHLAEGKLPPEAYEELHRNLSELLNLHETKEWFLPKATVRNEVLLIAPDKTLHRPDRLVFFPDKTLVIDYKTGKQEEHFQAQHIQQVQRYMDLLSKQGFPETKGFVLYVDSRQVVKVA